MIKEGWHMRKILYVFSIFYFSLFSPIYGGFGDLDGNRTMDCGVATYVVKNRGLMVSVNLFFTFTHPFATTSGTSECKGFSINDEQRINYIATNFYNIQANVVKGGGVYLDALTTIMGCEGTNFQIILKNDYESIFNEDNSDGKKIYNALRYKVKNSELKNHCIDYS